MSVASPDPSASAPVHDPEPLPLRRRNPPLHPGPPTSRSSMVSLVVIVIGYLISLGAPSLVVSPGATSAPLSRVVAAFGLTVLGVVISLGAGLLAFRRTHNWAWLIITGVPAVSLIAGGAILAATKVIT
jgi:hypothetical protein